MGSRGDGTAIDPGGRLPGTGEIFPLTGSNEEVILTRQSASIDAGWSSLEARRAHNPKVVGSNPTPATKYQPGLR